MVNDPRPRPDIVPTVPPRPPVTRAAPGARTTCPRRPGSFVRAGRPVPARSAPRSTFQTWHPSGLYIVNKTRHRQSNCPYGNKKKRTVSRPIRDPVLRRDTLADTNHAHAIVVVVLAVVLAGVEPEAQAEPARFQVEVDPRRSRNRQTQILQTKHSVSQLPVQR